MTILVAKSPTGKHGNHLIWVSMKSPLDDNSFFKSKEKVLFTDFQVLIFPSINGIAIYHL